VFDHQIDKSGSIDQDDLLLDLAHVEIAKSYELKKVDHDYFEDGGALA